MLNVAMFIYLGFIRCLVLPVSAEMGDVQQAEIGPEDLAGRPVVNSSGRGDAGQKTAGCGGSKLA